MLFVKLDSFSVEFKNFLGGLKKVHIGSELRHQETLTWGFYWCLLRKHIVTNLGLKRNVLDHSVGEIESGDAKGGFCIEGERERSNNPMIVNDFGSVREKWYDIYGKRDVVQMNKLAENLIRKKSVRWTISKFEKNRVDLQKVCNDETDQKDIIYNNVCIVILSGEGIRHGLVPVGEVIIVTHNSVFDKLILWMSSDNEHEVKNTWD